MYFVDQMSGYAITEPKFAYYFNNVMEENKQATDWLEKIPKKWTTLSGTSADDDPGRPPGIVLSAATSFWLPVPPKWVFDFLRDENSRNEVCANFFKKRLS